MPKVVNNKFGLIAEKLSQASPSRPACAECGLYKSCSSPFVKPYIPEDWSGRYAFVTETSREGDEEYARKGIPLGQRERTQLKMILQEVGIKRNDVALVPTLRCRPILTGSKKPKMHDIRACRPFLLRSIQTLNPYLTIAFGDTAIKGLTNTGSPGPLALLRGRQLNMVSVVNGQPQEFLRVYATNKIQSLLNDPHAAKRMTEDLHRLNMPELEYPKKELPNGTEKEIGFDTEYSGTEVFTIGVADSKRGIALPTETIRRSLHKVIGNAILVGHNLPVDLEAIIRIRPRGIEKALELWLQGRRQRDTVLEARLSDENRGKHGYKLESLAVSLFNVKDWKGPTEALGPDSAKWPPHLRDERCRLDAWATLKIHQLLSSYVEGPSRLSHEIAMSLRRMYFAGVYIDATKYKNMQKTVTKKRKESLDELLKFVKKFKLKDFSPTNDTCIREYVYGENGVGLDVESYTKGGLPSVSAKVLKEYKDEKAIQALLTFSKYDKLESTYTNSLASKFETITSGTSVGLWMPVIINPLAAKTGRRASAAPNFQNWPVSVRQIIVSRFTGGSIADNDYSKLEPILGGWVAKEPRLTDYFVKYPNGYIKIGEDFFKKTVEKNTKEYTMMKSLVLAIIYKKMKWSLAEDLWVTHGVKLAERYDDHIEKAGELLNDFLDMFKGIKRYHRDQEEIVLTEGKIYNALGQARRLPLPPEPPRSEKLAYKAWMRYKAHVINQAVNYPIQSLAAYVTGCGLIDTERAFLTNWKHSYLEYQTSLMEKKWPKMPLICIEVHDDLVMDVPKGLEKKTKEITHEVMIKPPSLVAVLPELFDSNVKLSVDTNMGPTWGLKN